MFLMREDSQKATNSSYINADLSRPTQPIISSACFVSSWSAISNVNTARYQNAATTAGAPDAFLIFGGNPNRTLTELWDGSSWTEVSDLSGGRHSLGGAGAATSALAFGGSNPSGPGAQDTTEEWSASDFEIKTVTTS